MGKGRIDRKTVEDSRLSMTDSLDSLAEMRRKQEELDKFLLESEEYFTELGKEDVIRNRSLVPPRLCDFHKNSKGKEISFKGNKLIKPAGVKLKLTEDHIKEMAFCSLNPTYTIRNYCRIVSQDRGLINFDLYPFQEETVLSLLSGKRHMIRSGRQSGKTMTIAATILFYCIFNKNKNVALVANKRGTANEILERIQTIYTGLPMWLKPGVTKWNTNTVTFENGCKIMTSATSAASIRGQAIAFLYIDEICFIRKKLWEEFDRSTFPVISASKLAKIAISSTPKGHDHFYQMWTASEKGRSSYTTRWVRWWEVPGRDEKWKEGCIRDECKGDLEYFSQEFDAAFTTGGGTFIGHEGEKWLSSCQCEPLREDKLRGIRWFEDPQPEHSYVISIDPAEGKGLNFHAAMIFDVTELPFKCVCTYKSNQEDLITMPYVVSGLGRSYNDAFLLIENNNTGAGVARDLMHDLEYPNMHSVVIDRPEIRRKFTEPGIRTSLKTKRIGQDYAKYLLDNGKVLVPDILFHAELDNLIKNSTTQLWGANDEAINDDLFSTFRLFAFFAKTESFENALGKGKKRATVDPYAQKEKENSDENYARIFIRVDGSKKSSFSKKKKKNPNMIRIGEMNYVSDNFRMR